MSRIRDRTFAQFEEGNILTETCNDTENGYESDNEYIMMNKQDMENIDSNEKSDHDLISMETLEDICDRSQTHPTVIKGKHVVKYVILLRKDNQNGRER